MNCSNCGNEIELGNVYCPKCGKEAFIVSDANILEDEELKDFLTEEDKKEEQARIEAERQALLEAKKAKQLENASWFVKKIWSKTPNRIIFLIVCALLLVGIIVGAYFGSYFSHLNKGKSYDDQTEYEGAIIQYDKAINLRSKAIEPRVLKAYDYMNLEDYDTAEEVLLEAQKINPTDSTVIEALIKLYSTTNSSSKLNKLKASITDPELKSLFDSALVKEPSFSQKPGKYTENTTIELEADSDCDIYYTLDGTTPSKSSGTKYRDSIELTDGNTTIKAIAINKNGTKSLIKIGKYKIEYAKPSDPVISPDGGNMNSVTGITISADSDCTIYYTWDGTTPTSSSNKYTGPIDVIEGNNVLSAIAINDHDMTSDVVKANFIYLP